MLTKIKPRVSGYRLVYRVHDDEIAIYVLSVGRREKREAYEKARTRVK
uniref:ParE toxin of type II toxin-antitoxin system, parDE n=1 Tax=Candidatus Kentrum sp. LFY TaxID=2126342 RepID=A0A450W7L5_9GAMM|nr:MAG: ParE toxin of type II toxin-antitoxin system, parDE [Candidatus Kentron sp. LFY]